MTGSRDWAGSIFTTNGTIYRQIERDFQEEFDAFVEHPLFQSLVAQGVLVPHVEAPLDLRTRTSAYRVIKPDRIPFISYPYEWSFEQLRDAALLTLAVQSQALRAGFSLRDASAFNIQFIGTRPLLIDTLSIGRRKPNTPWFAYRQFCEHFLVPLALMSLVDEDLRRLHATYSDGIPLRVGTGVLRWKLVRSFGLQWHIGAHGALQLRASDRRLISLSRGALISDKHLQDLVSSLAATIHALRVPRSSRSPWAGYDQQPPYSAVASKHKEETVLRWIAEERPGILWDLGANRARFSRPVGQQGTYVVAIDSDPRCIGSTYSLLRTTEGHDAGAVLPLIIDLCAPSMAGGIGGTERASLEERGPADMSLALALVHHLTAAGSGLDRTAAWLARFARSLTVEFVPLSDSTAALLANDNPEAFRGYSQQQFERAFEARFRVLERVPVLDSCRVLYRMTRIRT